MAWDTEKDKIIIISMRTLRQMIKSDPMMETRNKKEMTINVVDEFIYISGYLISSHKRIHSGTANRALK